MANFQLLREDKSVYVDKTHLLQKIVTEGRWYFLSRPRRFGKSLTISTLEAMFQGKTELFSGLAAESWVSQQNKQITPIFSLDFSKFDSNGSAQSLNNWLNRKALAFAHEYHVAACAEASCSETLDTVFERVAQSQGPITLLIDEYDSPILDNVFNANKAHAFRTLLRSFYKVIKGSGKQLSFVFITGVSKFTKTGIFSALNNLNDISMNQAYGALTGYTQAELEKYFLPFLEKAITQKVMPDKASLLQKIRNYYDGFSFDGFTKVYNPFSILNFFDKYTFDNFWYEYGSMTAIENYFKDHNIQSPEKYHLVHVDSEMIAPRELEETTPESFLFQAGYLTIAQRKENELILDYPNQEVFNALSKMFLHKIYQIPSYNELGKKIWEAVHLGDLERIAQEYNVALASPPYHDFLEKKASSNHDQTQSTRCDESFYRALLLMLLRGCGIQGHGEVPTCRGRSDVLVECAERILLIEFKLAKSEKEIAKKRREGEEQILNSDYLAPYATQTIPVRYGVFVVNTEKRQVFL
ncbi:MAG: ATP-binding protein [Desulfovibrio sp.]|nr:ATP-binding protein [Desulfovibrio sp.]